MTSTRAPARRMVRSRHPDPSRLPPLGRPQRTSGGVLWRALDEAQGADTFYMVVRGQEGRPSNDRTCAPTVITRNVTREHYFESALERTRHAFQAIATGPKRRDITNGVPDSEARLLSRSASFLFFGAGTIAVANSYLASLHGANIQALRLTGLLSMLAAFGVPLLPWSWNRRLVASSLVIGAVGFVVLSDQLNHFSHTQSAVAVYPVFFIMVVAWAGFIQIRGVASITALLSGLALSGMLLAGGHQSISWECALVSMSAAAVLGEVLAWSHKRVASRNTRSRPSTA